MNQLASITLAALLLAPVASPHAAEVENHTKVVPIERMQQVYDEVKTPFKYGVVIRGEEKQLVDSPSVFRKDGQWYMIKAGYEKIGMAVSDDMIHWISRSRQRMEPNHES